MENLRALRRQAGLTMKQLGSDLGMAESTVSLYETGKRSPDAQTLIRFADYFNVTLDYLLGRTKERTISLAQFQLSEHEKEIIRSYRSISTGRQEVICDILHIDHPSIAKAN